METVCAAAPSTSSSTSPTSLPSRSTPAGSPATLQRSSPTTAPLGSNNSTAWLDETLAVGIVVLFTLVNFLGSRIMGQAETAIVAIKVGVLVLFIAAGIFFVQPDRLAPSGWGEPQNLLFGAGILFIGYESFGLITNAAGEMTNPRRELPRAIYLAVGIVILIYILVAIVVIGNLSISALKAAEDSALAEAARPFLGQFGFTLIAIAALLSTSSAVNATLFGAANVSYQVAKDVSSRRVSRARCGRATPKGYSSLLRS